MDQKFAYAGIGARNTPEDILPYMVGAAQQLEAFGLILRSGAAEGADAAFEAGVRDPENKEIYLPCAASTIIPAPTTRRWTRPITSRPCTTRHGSVWARAPNASWPAISTRSSAPR